MPRTRIAACARRRGTVSEGVFGQGRLGRLNEARHEKTGVPGLILVPTGARMDLAPVVELELRVRTSSSLAFVVLEMGACPEAPASDVEAEVADVMKDIADAVQAALGKPRKLAHLLRTSAGRPPDIP